MTGTTIYDFQTGLVNRDHYRSVRIQDQLYAKAKEMAQNRNQITGAIINEALRGYFYNLGLKVEEWVKQ